MKQSKFTCKTYHIKASRSFLGLFLLCVLIFSNGCTITSMDQNESDSELPPPGIRKWVEKKFVSRDQYTRDISTIKADLDRVHAELEMKK